jgi:hypothetical protein
MSKTKVSITPQDMNKKWSTAMKNAIPYIQQGVNNVTESPMAKAALKADKMLNNLTQAVQSGRWATALNNVSLQSWKDVTSKKITSSLSAGVDAAQQKQTAFATWLIGVENAGLAQIASMPDVTLDDSINRSVAWQRYMANNKYKK